MRLLYVVRTEKESFIFCQDWGFIYILSGLRSHLYFCPGLRRSHLYFCPGLRRSYLYFAQDWGGVIYILPRTEEELFIYFWLGLRRSHLYILARTEEESFIYFCPGLRRSHLYIFGQDWGGVINIFAQDWGGVIYIFAEDWGGVTYILVRTEGRKFVRTE